MPRLSTCLIQKSTLDYFETLQILTHIFSICNRNNEVKQVFSLYRGTGKNCQGWTEPMPVRCKCRTMGHQGLGDQSPLAQQCVSLLVDSLGFQTQMVSSKLLFGNSHWSSTADSGIPSRIESLDHLRACALLYFVERSWKLWSLQMKQNWETQRVQLMYFRR